VPIWQADSDRRHNFLSSERKRATLTSIISVVTMSLIDTQLLIAVKVIALFLRIDFPIGFQFNWHTFS
jgi:hypothetical protein